MLNAYRLKICNYHSNLLVLVVVVVITVLSEGVIIIYSLPCVKPLLIRSQGSGGYFHIWAR